ncbi:MAG: response regulator [Chthoniobacteraceae bacterium]
MSEYKRIRILVVDDDKTTTGVIRTLLERIGQYSVQVENEPESVMNAARDFQPDLILLDVMMPEKDGHQLAAELRTVPALSRIPIVFVTALISAAEEGLRGGEHYLSKPVNPLALIETVGSRLTSQAA